MNDVAFTHRPSPTAARPRQVLIVDDDVSSIEVASRVTRELGAVPRVAQTFDTAMGLARSEAPAVLLSAIDIGGRPVGLSLGRALRPRCNCAVIFVGSRLSMQHLGAVTAVRPEGFLCRPLRPEQVEATLRLALGRVDVASTSAPTSGIDPNLARTLRQIAALVNGTGVLDLATSAPAVPTRSLAALRPREQEVVRLLFDHCRVPTIAARLGISPQTVRNHLKHAYQSLGVHSQQELMAHFLQLQAPAVPQPEPLSEGWPTSG
jgi:DNA-binding NarL/FixJ family response regulator